MFDLDSCYDLFASEPNSAYFWSGLGPKGQYIAADIADKKDGVTLEMLMREHKSELIEAGFEYSKKYDRFLFSEENYSDWEKISNAFAEQASGEVHVILGDNVREDGVWRTKEFPALSENERVTKITSVDATGQEKEVLLDRTNKIGNSNEQHDYNSISSKNIAAIGGGGARAPDDAPQGPITRSEIPQSPDPKKQVEGAPAGAKSEDLDQIKNSQTNNEGFSGPANLNEIAPDKESTILKNLSADTDNTMAPENGVVNAAAKAAGGMSNG